ncbi:MAG: PQQ-dependent sugar dehydrogenase [Chloroflexota bacterium]
MKRRLIFGAFVVGLIVATLALFNVVRPFILRPASSGFYKLVEVVNGLKNPLYVTSAKDGSGRLFVVEQDGLIRIIRDGKLLEAPFLDVKALVSRDGSERGLLGLAFHPHYADNGTFFINYTDTSGNTVLARYHVSADDLDRADVDSAEIILHVDQPYPNHSAGQLAFGPDGYLYVGLGDGGSAGDPQGNGQNGHTLLGKMLRLDVDSDSPYAIPPNNPFIGRPDFALEIWAYGLRNPWRYSFDRATGDLYIADVGQNTWEEINFQPAGDHGGENYGWNVYEGLHPYQNGQAIGAVPPIAEYNHSDGCSVTGGYVYRGNALPDLQGTYLFGDYCSGTIWAAKRDASGAWQTHVLMNSGIPVSSFGEDEAGELYVVNYGGSLLRLAAG